MAEKKDHDPALAALYNKIADNGGAEWIGDSTPNVGRYVGKRADMILKSGFSPLRHLQRPQARLRRVLGGRRSGGRQAQQWITASPTAWGIGARLSSSSPTRSGCSTRRWRTASRACQRNLRRSASRCCASRSTPWSRWGTPRSTSTRDSGWLKASVDAKLLKEAGIEEADGFALNVSNYKATARNRTAKRSPGSWAANTSSSTPAATATGRRVDEAADHQLLVQPAGTRPRDAAHGQHGRSADRRLPLVEAPAESDGKCNGGPRPAISSRLARSSCPQREVLGRRRRRQCPCARGRTARLSHGDVTDPSRCLTIGVPFDVARRLDIRFLEDRRRVPEAKGDRHVLSLYLLRHGETEFSQHDRFCGRIDAPLTRTARDGHAVCCGLRRPQLAGHHHQHARPRDRFGGATGGHGGHRRRADERLDEMHYGSWQGLSKEEAAAQDRQCFARWQRDPASAAPRRVTGAGRWAGSGHDRAAACATCPGRPADRVAQGAAADPALRPLRHHPRTTAAGRPGRPAR